MNNKLYDKIMKSIENTIKSSINEQFNIGKIDLNSKKRRNMNIFNKDVFIPETVFEKMITPNNFPTEHEIKKLNDYVAAVKIKSLNDLNIVVDYYSEIYIKDSMNWIDTSEITSMAKLFMYSDYTGDISKWDVSNVTDMQFMFKDSTFNNDISQWDVHNVTDMYSMFSESQFNGDISGWDTHNVKNVMYMFYKSKFNQDISGWDLSNVKFYFDIFYNCPIKKQYRPVFK